MTINKTVDVAEMTIRIMLRFASRSLAIEWNTGSHSMNPWASAQQGTHGAHLHQAGARHGSRANAALGILEGSLTLHVTIKY